jgi:hypothetical protein
MKMNWEPKQVAYLKENYATSGNGALSSYFGCTTEAIQKKACKLGLKKAKPDVYSGGLMGINGHMINFNKSTGIRGEVLKLKPFNPNGKKLVKIDQWKIFFQNTAGHH